MTKPTIEEWLIRELKACKEATESEIEYQDAFVLPKEYERSLKIIEHLKEAVESIIEFGQHKDSSSLKEYFRKGMIKEAKEALEKCQKEIEG